MPNPIFKQQEEADDINPQMVAFAVADAEPTDEDIPPCDGAEYLRRVRKEAKALPDVVWAEIKPSQLRLAEERTARRFPAGTLSSLIDPPPPPAPPGTQPLPKWQHGIIAEFSQLRGKLRQVDAAHRPMKQPLLSAAPSDRVVLGLEQPAAVALLEKLQRRLSEEGGPSELLGQWIFAVLVRLEKELDADTAATVRSIFRTCTSLRATLAEPSSSSSLNGGECTPNTSACSSSGEAPDLVATHLSPQERVRRVSVLNLLITLSGGFFGQAPAEEWLGAEGS